MTTKKERQLKIRQRISGTPARPRLTIFHSLKHIYAQIIDDKCGKTLIASSDLEIKEKKNLKPMELSFRVGETIAKKALSKKINQIVFDRSGNQYHGHIKAVAEGARKGGLKF